MEGSGDAQVLLLVAPEQLVHSTRSLMKGCSAGRCVHCLILRSLLMFCVCALQAPWCTHSECTILPSHRLRVKRWNNWSWYESAVDQTVAKH